MMSSTVQRRFRPASGATGEAGDTGSSSGDRVIYVSRSNRGGPPTSSYQPTSHRDNAAIDQLMTDLEGWREVILLMDGLLNWERPRILCGVYVGLTGLFILMWLLDPTVLTTVSVLLLVATLMDYIVPLVAPRLLTIRTAWTVVEENRYRMICHRLVNAKRHMKDAFVWLFELRRDRPTFYFALVVPCLFVLSVIGDRVNNMFLTYAILSVLLFLPGLRHHGFLTQAKREVSRFIGTNLGMNRNRPLQKE